MHEVETVRPPLPPEALSLPARYYTNPEYYRSELESFFFAIWVHVGRAEEISSPGDFLVCEVAGESVILVRDQEGGLSAYYNVCRHRGTRLTEEKSGRFASTIQCPYHAWTYDLKGCLLAAPKMEKVADFRLEDYPLHQVAVDVWDGHIFLHLGENLVPLGATTRRRGRAIPAMGDGPASIGRSRRIRRRGELEADHSQLLGMSALSGGASCAAKAFALPYRRERAGD